MELMRIVIDDVAGELALTTVRSFPAGAIVGTALLATGAVAVGALLFSRGGRTARGH